MKYTVYCMLGSPSFCFFPSPSRSLFLYVSSTVYGQFVLVCTTVCQKGYANICPKSLDSSYIAGYNIKWAKTSLTYSMVQMISGCQRVKMNYLNIFMHLNFLKISHFDGQNDPPPRIHLDIFCTMISLTLSHVIHLGCWQNMQQEIPSWRT